MKRVRVMLIGGFLGAGKTTLLARAAEVLVRRGLRVGLITNDQAEDLVDTEVLRSRGLAVREIAGGCFCCQFTKLVEAGEELIRSLAPDVLLGEAVGSCTDLAATVLRPLRSFYGDWFAPAPFTVLADPPRLRDALTARADGTLPHSVLYIFSKQLEEADLIAVNKVDQLSAAERAELLADVRNAFPGRAVLEISALTGEGVEAWMEALDRADVGGSRVIDVDYDTYAEGEALLGWYNASVLLYADAEPDWAGLCGRLTEAVRLRLAKAGAEIAHLKLFLRSGSGSVVANVTSSAGQVRVRDELTAPGRHAELTINARVHHDPEAIARTIHDCLGELARDGLRTTVQRVSSFRPGRPEPVHRLNRPVD